MKLINIIYVFLFIVLLVYFYRYLDSFTYRESIIVDHILKDMKLCVNKFSLQYLHLLYVKDEICIENNISPPSIHNIIDFLQDDSKNYNIDHYKRLNNSINTIIYNISFKENIDEINKNLNKLAAFIRALTFIYNDIYVEKIHELVFLNENRREDMGQVNLLQYWIFRRNDSVFNWEIKGKPDFFELTDDYYYRKNDYNNDMLKFLFKNKLEEFEILKKKRLVKKLNMIQSLYDKYYFRFTKNKRIFAMYNDIQQKFK